MFWGTENNGTCCTLNPDETIATDSSAGTSDPIEPTSTEKETAAPVTETNKETQPCNQDVCLDAGRPDSECCVFGNYGGCETGFVYSIGLNGCEDIGDNFFGTCCLPV